MAGKRPSGGARATLAKRARQAAARARTGGEEPTDRYRRLGAAPVGHAASGHAWLADVMLLTIEEALDDIGLAPEARREQVGRLVAQAAKVMEPAKLSAKLAEYERALEELNDHAAPVSGAEDSAPRSPATLS